MSRSSGLASADALHVDASPLRASAPSLASPSSPPASPPPPPAADAPPSKPIRPRRGIRPALWALFSDPSSSNLAKLIALLVILSILVSVCSFVVQTLPQYAQAVPPAPVWYGIEVATITVFTVEFGVRLLTCPSLKAFVTSPMNAIDLLSILPFYVDLAMEGDNGSGASAFLRVVRLVRIFRVFKLSRYLPWVRVFSTSMLLSAQPLLMLVFVIGIAVVVYASAIYFVERGDWDEEAGMYMRVGLGGIVQPSPFQSIPDSMWWAIVTMTTVGYGDAYPVTPGGRTIASLAALSGILVLAIPITIISTNFNSEYAKLEGARSEAKARLTLMRAHFRARKSGLDAVLDEVDDLVRRNTLDLRCAVDSLLDASRDELTREVSEIVRMAYEQRRQLHLAAIAGGVDARISVEDPSVKELVTG